MAPVIRAFFDEPTHTVSYLVADPATREAAVSLPKHRGRTAAAAKRSRCRSSSARSPLPHHNTSSRSAVIGPRIEGESCALAV